MDFKVRKVFTQSGISLAIVIPKPYAEELDLVDGSKVYVSIKGEFLVIQKVPEPVEVLAEDIEIIQEEAVPS